MFSVCYLLLFRIVSSNCFLSTNDLQSEYKLICYDKLLLWAKSQNYKLTKNNTFLRFISFLSFSRKIPWDFICFLIDIGTELSWKTFSWHAFFKSQSYEINFIFISKLSLHTIFQESVLYNKFCTNLTVHCFLSNRIRPNSIIYLLTGRKTCFSLHCK